MAIEHSAKWIDKWQGRIREPINNTKRYYYKGSIIQICTVVLAYWGIKHLLKLRKYLNSYINLATDCLVKGRAITNDGAPGAERAPETRLAFSQVRAGIHHQCPADG